MKTKSVFLTSLLFFCSLFAFSQRNPNREILVFFNQGVSQKFITTKGKTVKVAYISNAKLKSSLTKIGIAETMLEAAIPDFNQKDTLKLLTGGSKLYQADMTKLYRIKVPLKQNREELINELNSLLEVLYAEPNGSVEHDAIPSDSYFPQQWGLKNTLHPGRDIHAEAAWDIYTGNVNNIIAIIDGGTNKSHPDLNDKISGGDNGYGWDGHGIHVSGIAAAESNNNQGVSGVDWHARIHAQRIDNVPDDAATYQAIVDAVNYSSNVSVLNNSWGLTDKNGNSGRYSTTVKLAYVYTYNANRTMVSSMGNHNVTQPGVPNYPAGFGIGIAVGATDNNDNIANFSVHGNYIDVSAPGVGIYSTLNNGYGNMSGTSMATPFVSGIASLLKGYNQNLANDDIENIIRLSADDKGVNGFDNTYGYGRVNAEQALKYLQAPYELHQWSASGGSVASSTGKYTHVFISASGLASGTYLVKRHEVKKTVNYPQSFFKLIGVWGRGASTNGWNQSNPNLGKKFCEVVSGTATTTGVTLRTYVYQVWSISGAYLGYYPASPSNVQLAYTVLGIKAPTISGASIVCVSNSTFTLHNRPPSTAVTWTKSNNLSYVSGQGTNNYRVRASSSSTSGSGWVQANINGAAVRKTFWVGKPNFTLDGETEVGVRMPGIAIIDYPNDQYQGVTNVNWTRSGAIITVNGYLTTGKFRAGSQAGYGAVYANATNACGSKESRLLINVTGGWYKTYPNPAKDILTVEIEQDKMSKEMQTKEVEIRLYDKLMIMKKHKVFKGNLIRLNLNDLKPDVYILQLKIGDEIFEEKIMHSY